MSSQPAQAAYAGASVSYALYRHHTTAALDAYGSAGTYADKDKP